MQKYTEILHALNNFEIEYGWISGHARILGHERANKPEKASTITKETFVPLTDVLLAGKLAQCRIWQRI